MKLFVGFNLLRTNQTGTTMVLAHGKFISVFDILAWKWIFHCEYEDDILCLFRHYTAKDDRY